MNGSMCRSNRIGALFASIMALFAIQVGSAQASDFRVGYQVVGDLVIYAEPNGDVYWRSFQTNQPWTSPPIYQGNYFGDGSTTSDFQAAYRIMIATSSGSPLIVYALPNGDFYWRALQTEVPWSGPPHYQGNYFGGGPTGPDFQTSYQIMNGLVVYSRANGDFYWRGFQTNVTWSGPPLDQGNYFGDNPLPTSRSTIGNAKSRYR